MTYNIGFTHTDGHEDETQFDIERTEELLPLFFDFIKENNYTIKSINYVEEE